MDEPLPLPTCSPADVARGIRERRKREADQKIAAMLRVLEWNQQMTTALEEIVRADVAGHGVVIRTSHERNMIEAIGHETVPRHEAYVFDYDRPDSGPFRKRLHVQYTATQKD